MLLSMAYWYTECWYLFMLMCWIFTCIGFITFLYVIIYICLRADEFIGRLLYKIFKEGKGKDE